MPFLPRADLVPNTLAYETEPLVKATGFREYDARWLFGPDINLLGIQALGLGLGTYIHELGQSKIVVGHDFRSYSLSIKNALMLGLVAAAGLVVFGSVALYATATTPDGREEQAAELDAETDPAWYRAIGPALPAGFQSIAVFTSNDWYVHFVSFDPVDGRRLQLTVSRTAIEPDPGGAITLDQALTTPPGQPLELLDISLPDGRQVSAFCAINQTSCPQEGAGAISSLELRDLVLHLAMSVTPSGARSDARSRTGCRHPSRHQRHRRVS